MRLALCARPRVRIGRLRGRVGGRYALVDLVKLNALDVGLWQSRRRTIALFALEPPKYDFKHLVAQLCASEKTRAIPLEQCLVDDTDGEQLREYGISEADLAERKVLTGKQAASLQTALARLQTALGRLDPPVSLDDASKEWIFCDTRKSDKFAGATIGHAPTLTASSRSVWCTRLGRPLHPIEHGLLQGWQDDQIKARASALPCRAELHPHAFCVAAGGGEGVPGSRRVEDRRLGRRVAGPASLRPHRCDRVRPQLYVRLRHTGRAIPMEFHFVLLRALALCYPAVFHVHERRPAPARRSARSARVAAAAAGR